MLIVFRLAQRSIRGWPAVAGSTQPAVLITDVEASVADWWTRVQLSETRIADIREQVMAELTRRQSSNHRELEQQQQKASSNSKTNNSNS
jgi:hypothetical protein